jgi:PTS system nitrogen regulatory IIA component
MITIGNTLKRSAIELNVTSETCDAAVAEVASLLEGDDRIRDWDEFFKMVKKKEPSIIAEDALRICLPHARTNAVRTMVIATGYSRKGFTVPGQSFRVHYVIVIGVPTAMAADYLRIVGALIRILRDPEVEQKLRTSETSDDFLKILANREMKL